MAKVNYFVSIKLYAKENYFQFIFVYIGCVQYIHVCILYILFHSLQLFHVYINIILIHNSLAYMFLTKHVCIVYVYCICEGIRNSHSRKQLYIKSAVKLVHENNGYYPPVLLLLNNNDIIYISERRHVIFDVSIRHI